MLYMVIERFKPGCAGEIYRRFAERGRMMPEGLRYVSSWIDFRFERCFQVMETDDESHFAAWTAHWDDLIEFEVVPVRTSSEAAAVVATSPRPAS